MISSDTQLRSLARRLQTEADAKGVAIRSRITVIVDGIVSTQMVEATPDRVLPAVAPAYYNYGVR